MTTLPIREQQRRVGFTSRRCVCVCHPRAINHRGSEKTHKCQTRNKSRAWLNAPLLVFVILPQRKEGEKKKRGNDKQYK